MGQLTIRSLVLLLVVCLITPAQSLTQNGAAPPNLNGFDGFVEQVMKDWKVPGIAVAIVKDGQVVYANGFGFRDVKKGLKVTPDTLFAIGSCSKAFTATALAILADEGKLDWDKPVRDYLTDFRLQDAYATARAGDASIGAAPPRHGLVRLAAFAPRALRPAAPSGAEQAAAREVSI